MGTGNIYHPCQSGKEKERGERRERERKGRGRGRQRGTRGREERKNKKEKSGFEHSLGPGLRVAMFREREFGEG